MGVNRVAPRLLGILSQMEDCSDYKESEKDMVVLFACYAMGYLEREEP